MMDVLCPFDLKKIGTVKKIDKNDVEEILTKAYSLFRDRDKWLEHYQRIDVLKKLANLVEKEADNFAMLIASEGGKPLIDAKIEVARAIDGINLAAKDLMHIMKGEEIPMGHTVATKGKLAFTTYEPIGVVLAVSAFNHPLNLIVHQIIPAIAVGCPVIIKPASNTPLCCKRLVELVHQAGLAKDWCQLAICSNEVASILVEDKRIGFFSFIGSSKVGWYLRKKLAEGTRCALEHGGVAPVIVDKNIELDKIVTSLVKGAFYHAGQVCVSVQKIYAEESIALELAKKIAEKAKKLKVGDARKKDTEVGPLIDIKEVERVDEWVKDAVNQGAELLAGGNKKGETCYEPTVLFNPSEDAIISKNEIFGPVVCIYSYKDRKNAIKLANSLDYAFQAAVFSNDLNVAMDSVKYLDATAVMVNDHTAFRCDWMPFSGRRHSGHGIGGIGYTMHDMINPKMMVLNY